jgi:hypothetical protein
MPTDKGKARTQLTALTEDFTFERTKAVITRRKQDEMLLAKARGELIAKDLVEKQAAYLLVAMRQKILGLPLTYARRLTNLTDVAQVHKVLKELAIALLNELRDLPQKVTDPNWLRELEKDEGSK